MFYLMNWKQSPFCLVSFLCRVIFAAEANISIVQTNCTILMLNITKNVINISREILILYLSWKCLSSFPRSPTFSWRRSEYTDPNVELSNYIIIIIIIITLAAMSGLAPLSSSRDSMSVWPSWAARWMGLIPCLVMQLESAPYSSRVVATSSWFFLEAMWRGVNPF